MTSRAKVWGAVAWLVVVAGSWGATELLDSGVEPAEGPRSEQGVAPMVTPPPQPSSSGCPPQQSPTYAVVCDSLRLEVGWD